MQPDGIEVVVGAVRDPQFGPVVMFGSGGGGVEIEQDVTFELAPVSRRDAVAMIDRTFAGRRLEGIRGAPAADGEAVIDVIRTVSELIVQVTEIEEFEINPLRVFEQGGGAVAIDVRCRSGDRTAR